MLTNVLKRLFGLRDGELRISFFMQLYIFLLISVLLMVKPTINALFLSKLGADHLPYGFVLVAVFAVVTSYFYSRIVKKHSLRIITIATLVFFALCFWALSVIMYYNSVNDWVLYAYYLSVAIFAVLVTSQFWLIANMVFNSREAKRLFGFIGAGAIAGGIFGGYLTTVLASSFGNMVVMLVAGFLILGCIPIIQIVWKLRIRRLTRYARSISKSSTNNNLISPLRQILNSKHLTYLAAIVGVGVLMARLVDFQFSDFSSKAIPDSDELASFFGFWFSSFNVAALLIQLFLTNKLLTWLGVTTNLLLLPLGIALGSLLFLTIPELWVLIIIKGIDGSFKQSINKAGIELSILPIPIHVKNQAKSYIDVVVDSLATGISGLLLIFVIRKLDLNTTYITVLILLVLFVWLVLVYKLREAYFESFRNNIQSSITSGGENPTGKLKNNSITRTREVLTSGEEQDILNLLDRLQVSATETYKTLIIDLLKHPSNKIKAAVIEQLYNYKIGTATQEVRNLLTQKDDRLVFVAMEYLINHTNLDDHKLFTSYLEHPTDYISNAALLCLAKQSASNKAIASVYGLSNRIDAKVNELFESDNDLRKQELAELLLTIAYGEEGKFYSFIAVQLNNKDPYVVNRAIIAAGITGHESFIDDLIKLLDFKEYRRSAQKALKAYGPSITKTILSKITTEQIPNNIRIHLPKVIESFKNRESITTLLKLLKSNDFVIRHAAAKSLNKLKRKFPSIKFDQNRLTRIIQKELLFFNNTSQSVNLVSHLLSEEDKDRSSHESDISIELHIARENLLELLEQQQKQGMSCIFKLLGLIYDPVDINVAYNGLLSETKDARVNSIEFLDNLLSVKLKSRILPQLEYHVIDAEEAQLESEIKLTEQQMLRMLLKNRGPNTKLVVLAVIYALNDPSYTKMIKPFIKHKNKSVAIFARQIIQSFTAG